MLCIDLDGFEWNAIIHNDERFCTPMYIVQHICQDGVMLFLPFGLGQCSSPTEEWWNDCAQIAREK